MNTYPLKTRNGNIRLTKVSNVWYMRKTIEGKQREISLRTGNQNLAEKRGKDLLDLCNQFPYNESLLRLFPVKNHIPDATATKPAEMTIEKYLSFYDQYCLESDRAPSFKTAKNYKGCLRKMAKDLNLKYVTDLQCITAENLLKFHKNAISRNTAVRQSKAPFKENVLKWLRRKNIEIENPFRNYELSKVRIAPYVPLSPTIRTKLENDIKKESYIMELLFLLAYNCGFRRAESDKARLSWVTKTDKGGMIKIQKEIDFDAKSKISRVIPISAAMYKKIMLLRGNSESEYLVPSSVIPRLNKAKYMGRQNVHGNYRLDNEFDKIITFLKKYGLDYHDLRKEAGSKIASKYGLFQACEILGHADYKTTLAYYSSCINLPVLQC